MTELNSTWLCALLLASGKISARDVTPADLEDFDSFIARRSRRELIGIEDALEFAMRKMSEVDGPEALAISHELNKFLGMVRGTILLDKEIVDYFKQLVAI